MDKNIQTILDELYLADKSLKKYEPELIKIIESLIASRPKVKFDESFKSQLRSELLEKFNQIKQQDDMKQKLKTNNNFMNKLFYALGGAALVVLLIVLPNLSKDTPGQLKLANKTEKANFSFEVLPIQDRAFGSLTDNSGGTAPTAEAAGLGGGGGITGTDSAMADSKMIAPMPVSYKYIYDGEIDFDQSQLPVYKKIKGSSAASSLAQMIQQTKFEDLNMSSFKNTQLRNFNITEDRDYGYSLYVDLYEGIISISENWERWPQPQYNEPIKIEQIPSDEKLISIADKFLADKKIDISQYGEPSVDNQWRLYYENSPEKDYYYIPEMISVVYPQIINEQEIYEEYGGKFGLRVNINIRENRASGAWGISSQKYQSSLYDMETDTNRLKKLAEQGGGWPIYYAQDSEIVEVKLGEPKLAYTSAWHYDGMQSYQLFVPALVFPVLEQPTEGYYYKETVVVPLAKDIVDSRLTPIDQPGVPMPLIER
ncbi:hypothetical protein KKH39_03240 [Patescibacteria group bacterium]|nr:hypothetical protein [Patescibacteria group bacterium]